MRFISHFAATRRALPPTPRFALRLKRLSVFALLIGTLVFLCADVAQSQIGGNPSSINNQDDNEEIQIRTDLITVPVTVSDGRGRFVETLTQKDFLLLDNLQPVTLAYFARGANTLALTIMLDTSGSMRDLFATGRDAGVRLLERFAQNSRIALVTFNDAPHIVTPMTGDLSHARTALPQLAARPNTHTAIFDSVYRTLDIFNDSPATERRILIVISDGRDTVSRTPFASVIAEAEARGITIYFVHVPFYLAQGDSLKPLPPVKGIAQLTARTGGKLFKLMDVQAALNPSYKLDLTPVFEAIAQDLNSQYILGFYPSDKTTNLSHQLRLTLPAHKKLRPRLLRSTYTLRRVSPQPNAARVNRHSFFVLDCLDFQALGLRFVESFNLMNVAH